MKELLTAKRALVFDVESVGLHGVGFAYGACMVDLDDGHIGDESRAFCRPIRRGGTIEGFDWVSENVVPTFDSPEWVGADFGSPEAVRAAFWNFYTQHRGDDVVLVADCAWPVEARFLAECIDDGWGAIAHGRASNVCEGDNERYWQGPYPLIDASTLFALVNVSHVERDATRGETPVHDPLADARHSARQLVEALRWLHGVVHAAGVRL